MTDTDPRQAYIDGLHQIADFLAEHPEVPLPYLGGDLRAGVTDHSLPIYLVTGSQRDDLAAIARAMGSASKVVQPDSDRFYVLRKFGAITLTASADRAEVCDRVVTGTREVTREVPDPEALAAVPKVTVTETVEDVDWVCGPLLAKAPNGLVSL
jgi:hypothetical protein